MIALKIFELNIVCQITPPLYLSLFLSHSTLNRAIALFARE